MRERIIFQKFKIKMVLYFRELKKAELLIPVFLPLKKTLNGRHILQRSWYDHEVVKPPGIFS